MSVRRPRVLIAYQQLPHYRSGVFRRLDSEEAIHTTFAAGPSNEDGSIVPMDWSLLNMVIPLRNFWCRGLLLQPRLLRLSASRRFDVLVLEGDVKFPTTWLAAMIGRASGKRVLFWTIGWHRPESGLKWVIRSSFYRIANRVLLYGEDARSIAIQAGFDPSRLAVIGNSHDDASDHVPEVCSVVSSRRGVQNSVVVGAVARLTPEKRFDLLIRAVQLLQSTTDLILEVEIIGEGPEREGLVALARELQVVLRLPGASYDPSSIARFYEKCAVTVLPERAGLTVMQSLTAGCPVVTVDDPYRQVPEFRAVIDGRTGFLYERDDCEGLAAALHGAVEMVRRDCAQVAQWCVTEVSENWSSKVHAERVVREILSELE